jgi:hypothetical protein
MFGVFKLSFVVGILAFFDSATFWAIYHLVTLTNCERRRPF